MEIILIWSAFKCDLNLLFCFFWQILDLVPILARLYFEEKLPVKLSYVQASVLLCIGLQNQNISYIQVCLKTYEVLQSYDLVASNALYGQPIKNNQKLSKLSSHYFEVCYHTLLDFVWDMRRPSCFCRDVKKKTIWFLPR